MANNYKQIAQARENSTNAVSIFSPGANEEIIINFVNVTNTSGAAAKVRIFHDDDGTTYDESTANAWDINIPANSVWDREVQICMDNSSGNFAYRSDVANALTITIYGDRIT